MAAAVRVPYIRSFDKLINRKVKANGANVLIEGLYCNSVVTVQFFLSSLSNIIAYDTWAV